MSAGDYLYGLALLSVPMAAAAMVAWRVTGVWMRDLDRLERALAGLLVGLCTFIAVHLLPLALGVLSRATVMIASAAAVAAALVLVRGGAAAAPVARARPTARASNSASWLLGGGAVVAVLAAIIAALRGQLSLPVTGVDTLTFHLPNVARWMDSGSLWQIDQFIPLQAQGYYPNTGDVLLLGVVQPFDNDLFVRLPMAGLLVAFGVALWAVGREFGATAAASASVAAALCSIPILGMATIRASMPDVLLCFALAVALLFLLRHARGGRRSDLVLAGLGLGLALGTKWYGVPAAAIAVLVFAVVRVRAAGARRAWVDGGLLGAVAAATGGIWFVRNLVEVGNPFFPMDSALFGAPRDVVSEQVGFSISDYVDDPGVLFGDLPGELIQGLGWAPAVLATLAAVALALALRRCDPQALALGGAMLLLALAYTLLPNTALGFKGAPVEANFNTRYSLPALIVAAAVVLWGAARAPGRIVLAAQAALLVAVLLALDDAFTPLHLRGFVAALIALALVAGAGAALWAWPSLRTPALAAVVAALATAGGAAYLYRAQDRMNSQRYAFDPVLRVVQERTERFGSLDVAIAGDWNAKGVSPVWPAFGKRIENRVKVIGFDADGFLTNHRDARSFLAALSRQQPDLLIVGRGLFPRAGVSPPQERWAVSAGWRPLARTDRLVVLDPPRSRA